jgi:hypothetical protein
LGGEGEARDALKRWKGRRGRHEGSGEG